MKKRLFIYDFETNGFWSPRNQPIEVAVKIIEKDGSEVQYHRYIKCPGFLNLNIVRLTGITDAILEREGIDIKEVFLELNALLHVEDTLVIGHNILGFDNLFLNHYLNVFGCKGIGKEVCFDTSGQMKADLCGLVKPDVLSWGEFHGSVLRKPVKGIKHKLEDACDHYGVNKDSAFHNALADINYTFQVFEKQWNTIYQEV